MNEKLLYRIPEVASYLNVSRSKVYELLESGELSLGPHRSDPPGPLLRPSGLRRLPSCCFVGGQQGSAPRP